MHHHLVLGCGLLLASSLSLADWLPNPDKWLREQCHQRMVQHAQAKMSPPERQKTCDCMVGQAKSQLSASDLLNLARLSESQLHQKYANQSKMAFERCHKPTAISSN